MTHSKEAFTAEQEINSILEWAELVKKKLIDSDMPDERTFIGIDGGYFIEKSVVVIRDSRESIESWLFINQAHTHETVREVLPEKPAQKIQNLASKIGISEDTALDAAIKTRVLRINLADQPISLQFGNGPESLRLVPSYLSDRKTGKLIKMGRLEYYNMEKGGQYLSRLIQREPEGLSFPVLFRQVLTFKSHVAGKVIDKMV